MGVSVLGPDLPNGLIHLLFQGKQVGDEGAVEQWWREVLQERTQAEVRRQTVASPRRMCRTCGSPSGAPSPVSPD